MAIRQVSFAAPQQAQSPLVQALAPRDPRQMLAIQALQEGSSTAPVQSIGEGLTRLAQGALGGWFAGRQKRESEEASGRLADAILSSLPENQRTGPLAMALRDPNVAPGLIPGMLQQMATRREQWTPDPTGMFQVNSVTGERRPLESPERARAMAEAGRDPNSRFQIVPGTDGQPPLVVDRSQLGGTGGTLADRNNNPGNLRPPGQSTGFQRFETPEAGVSAMVRQLDLYRDRNNLNTVQAIISRWAPPNENDTAAYVRNVSQALGVAPDAPIDTRDEQTMRRLVVAMARQEGGRPIAPEILDRGLALARSQAQAQPQTATDAGPQYPPGVRPLISGQGGPSPREFNQANTLRDEFTRGSQTFQTVQDAYQNIRSAASNSTGAGDMSMLYSFVKLLDPTSVVRESEFATAAASGSLGERIQGLYQRIVSGERLPESLRRDFMREAEAIYRTHTQAQQQRTREWERLARLYRVDPAGVVVDLMRPELQQPWQPPAPPAQPQAVPAQPAAPAPMPPQTPIPQPGVGQGVQVPIPPQPAIVPEQAQPAVPPRGAIPRDQILEELRRRGLRVQ